MKLAKIFQNGMVLQRGCPVTIWGFGKAGEQVTAAIQGKRAVTLVKEDGAWEAQLPELETSEEETLTVTGEYGGTILGEAVLTDVAVGEVWIAGGQSNMEFPLCHEKHWKEEQGTANRSLRFYDVPEIAFDGQEKDFDYSQVGVWRKAQGEDLKYFSAVGYYFQKEIAADQQAPVGIIGCSWGGSRSCAWISPETLKEVGQPWLDLYEDSIRGLDMDQYWAQQHKNPANDTGRPGMGPFDKFILPRTPSMEEIGAFMLQSAREEAIARGMDPDQIDLSQIMAQSAGAVDPKTRPGCLYEHMTRTIAPYTARGFLWYQGESDDVPGLQGLYQQMLTGLIRDWRALWRNAGMPFFVVQLPGWKSWLQLQNLDYQTIRRCQEETAKTVEGVYLCSISDVGEELDIHPKDKRTVGQRLALLARRYAYGRELLCEAPRVERAERRDGTLVLTFSSAGAGLTVRGNRIAALTLWQEGRKLEFTEEIKGNQVFLTPEDAGEGPVTIELAQCPWYQVNLYNEAGIPAIPFSVLCQAGEGMTT